MAACSITDNCCMSDAEWLVSRAREKLKSDLHATRAWLTTAKLLYPDNFAIQFEAYGVERSERNVKEAANLLQDMFVRFPKEYHLQKEVQDISQAVQTDATDASGQFLKEVFVSIPNSIQCQMLLKVSEHTTDILDQCRMMLILMNRFPEFVAEHGIQLIEKLLSTEKHGHFPSCLNCYRKYCVVDVLPLVLTQCSTDAPPKQLYRWLHKAMTFYVTYACQASGDITPNIPDLRSSRRVCNTTYSASASKCFATIEGLSDRESHIPKSWESLWKVLELIGQKLNWQHFKTFSKLSKDQQCQVLLSCSQPQQKLDNKQVVYYGTVLFLECLFLYCNRVDGQQFSVNGNSSLSQLVLIEGFMKTEKSADSPPKSKKRKSDSSMPAVKINICNSIQLSDQLVENFITAIKCWELLHSTEALQKDFKKLCQQIKADEWIWMKTFNCDRLVYQGNFDEAIHELLKSCGGNEMRINLQLASCYYSLKKYSDACEKLLLVITSSSHLSSESTRSPRPVDTEPINGRKLQLLSFTGNELLPYCMQLLLTCFQEKAFSSYTNDMLLGHMIVLLQYDWPTHADILEKAVTKISKNGSFTYNLFFNYITNIDILEEFALLKSPDGGKISLDILPTSTKVIAQQRTVTRGVNKGVKEDFKVMLEKQVSRSKENVEQLIKAFLVAEKQTLLKNLL